MSLPFNITNPGINIPGLLTTAEQTFVTNLVTLPYATGDILYYNGTSLTRLPIGSASKVLTVSGGIPSWQTPGAGTGTVTSVSVVTANGVSGTVATDTTTPAITLTLGAITPSSIQVSGLTASQLLGTDASKNIVSLAVATYPSLTELTYVKGVTSSIQTQMNLKAPLASPTFTGTVTLPVGLTGVIRTDAGVVSVDTDVTDIVSAGSDIAAGKLELATDAETVTGTDTARATTPANIKAKMASPGTIGATTPANITGLVIQANTGFSPDINDGAYLGQSGTAFSDLYLASGALIDFAAGDMTLTHSAGILTLSNTAAGATGPILELYQNSASPAINDVPGTINFYGRDSAANKDLYASIRTVITDATSTAESGKLVFSVRTVGVNADELVLDGGSLNPAVSQGLNLGTAVYPFNSTFTTMIELGHASDTTLSRVSAGVVAVEGVTVPTISSTNTLTNKRIEPRIVSAASYTTDTGTSLDVSTTDMFVITAQAGALLFNAPGGTPVQGQRLIIRIKDNGTARALTWNAVFRAMGTALPSTTVVSKTLYLGFFYNSTDTKWDLVASAQEA